MKGTANQQFLFDLILEERERQDKKFGANRMLDDGEWLKIIIEEIGEVAKAMLENSPKEVMKELIQVAAVALVWLECVLRKKEFYNLMEMRDEN